MPVDARGRACLTFHTIQVKNGSMVSNENMSFLGEMTKDEDGALFKVERQLPGISMKVTPKGMLKVIQVMLACRKRLEAEASAEPDERLTQRTQRMQRTQR